MTFRRRVLLSSAWASGGQLAQAVVGAVSTVLLVRLLGPEAFGLFTLGLLFTDVVEIAVGRHAADFLVRERRLERGHEGAAFVALTGLATLAGLVIAGLATTLGGLFERPDLAEVLLAMAFLPLLTALGTVPQQMLVRRLHFAALAQLGTLALLAGSIAGVAMAAYGAGVWSLVVLEAVRRVVLLAGTAIASRWRPIVGFERRHLRAVIAFGARRIENRFLQYISIDAIPRYLIGQYLGVEALGHYSVARRLLQQLNNVLSGPITTVGFPVVARLSADDPALDRFVTGALRLGTWVVWPAVLGLIVVAPTLIPLIYGEGWGEATLTLQLLAIGFLRAPLSGVISAILTGFGALGWISRLHLVSIAVVLVLALVGLQFGLVGVAAALALRQWLMWPVGAYFVRRTTGYAPPRQLQVVAEAAVPALVMVGALLGWRALFEVAMPGPVELAVEVALGGAVYGLAWCVWNRMPPARARRELRALLGPRVEAGGGELHRSSAA